MSFDFLDWKPDGTGLPAEEIAVLAFCLLAPATGLHYEYTSLGLVPNDHGGQTAMYRLEIGGIEAMSNLLLRRLAVALKNSSPLAKLHYAGSRDIENNGCWELIVNYLCLSGECP